MGNEWPKSDIPGIQPRPTGYECSGTDESNSK
jgi:hypothetical protein